MYITCDTFAAVSIKGVYIFFFKGSELNKNKLRAEKMENPLLSIHY